MKGGMHDRTSTCLSLAVPEAQKRKGERLQEVTEDVREKRNDNRACIANLRQGFSVDL